MNILYKEMRVPRLTITTTEQRLKLPHTLAPEMALECIRLAEQVVREMGDVEQSWRGYFDLWHPSGKLRVRMCRDFEKRTGGGKVFML
jgi:hypothetical protein